MTIDRRSVLLGMGTLAALRGLPVWAEPAPSQTPAGSPAATELLTQMAEELLREYPESASYLGLDKGPRSALKSRLSDHSLEGIRRASAGAAARLKQLEAVDRSKLTSAVRLNLDVVATAHRLAVEGFHFPYGDVAMLNHTISYRNSPYVVAQNTGAFVEIPDFLDSHHDIANAADVDSYLTRLEAYGRAIDDENVRLAHDSAGGVQLPDFLLDKVVHQLTVARQIPIAEWGIVAGFARRAETYRKDAGSQAAKIAQSKIAPAMDRQIAEMKRQREHATSDAGAWKLPDGEAYYAWALRAGTTTNLTPEEVHKLGLEQLRQLQDRMEPLLRAQGLTKGTPGERMTALGKDPRYQFPNTDAGRQQILDYVNGRIADIRTRLPRAFATLVRGNLIVKRVPPSIENGAPDGYAGPGTIDGSQPGMYYINLRDTSIWPRYALSTLTYHEGIPGHVWQGEYDYKLPLIRSLMQFNAYSEGWALYAEQLADELGVYEGDPLGKLGYLQSLAFRACRLVVDTGIHAKRWTRDKATQWFATTNGSTVLEVQQEVDRYCVWPGQACGYKVGHTEINRLRDETRKALGNRFDLRKFDDAVVTNGNVPLTLLDGVIADFIAQRTKTQSRTY
ncbi:MAG TPA: DUF885 family protein [Steroidobacteraceae bacterium]|nr:DUF885 family protein [Steroidobacteraceae bacterium]